MPDPGDLHISPNLYSRISLDLVKEDQKAQWANPDRQRKGEQIAECNHLLTLSCHATQKEMASTMKPKLIECVVFVTLTLVTRQS
jgi:hypothetical protein